MNYLCYAGQTYYCFVTKYSTSLTKAHFTISGPSYNYVTLNRNGGSGGSSGYYNYSGTPWLYSNSSSASYYITKPTRTGYTFTGYYSSTSGGTQYYNASGGRVISHAMTANKALYARWKEKSFTITYKGMEGAEISSQPATHTYGTATKIPDPTKTVDTDVYTFMGWNVNGAGSLMKNLTLTATAYNDNITLKANWRKATDATIEDDEQKP